MKKTLAIIMAALGCATANAQEINAVVARQSNTTQEMVRLTNTPNVILNENGITLKEGETNVENYSFNDGNITILFGSAISEETAIGEGLAVTHPVVIESGGKLTVSGTMSNDDAQDLIIEDGGQLAFNIENQNGYLYAHKDGTTLTFNGELIASASAKPLAYDGNATFKGFNLIGNPYTCNATIDNNRLFYRMNGTGTEIILGETNATIAPCEGVFVQAQGGSESVSFKASKNGKYAITVNTANVEATYLHLIDNLTGEDTDLLAC